MGTENPFASAESTVSFLAFQHVLVLAWIGQEEVAETFISLGLCRQGVLAAVSKAQRTWERDLQLRSVMIRIAVYKVSEVCVDWRTETRTTLPTLDDLFRIGIHLRNCRRDSQEGAVGRAKVFVDLEMICLKSMSVEAGDASRRLFHDLKT